MAKFNRKEIADAARPKKRPYMAERETPLIANERVTRALSAMIRQYPCEPKMHQTLVRWTKQLAYSAERPRAAVMNDFMQSVATLLNAPSIRARELAVWALTRWLPHNDLAVSFLRDCIESQNMMTDDLSDSELAALYEASEQRWQREAPARARSFVVDLDSVLRLRSFRGQPLDINKSVFEPLVGGDGDYVTGGGNWARYDDFIQAGYSETDQLQTLAISNLYSASLPDVVRSAIADLDADAEWKQWLTLVIFGQLPEVERYLLERGLGYVEYDRFVAFPFGPYQVMLSYYEQGGFNRLLLNTVASFEDYPNRPPRPNTRRERQRLRRLARARSGQ